MSLGEPAASQRTVSLADSVGGEQHGPELHADAEESLPHVERAARDQIPLVLRLAEDAPEFREADAQAAASPTALRCDSRCRRHRRRPTAQRAGTARAWARRRGR